MIRPLIALLMLTTPAAAQDYTAFRSPTGNIHCAIFLGDWPGVRCDLMELTQTFTTPPPGCELDWGNSFFVGPSGPGELGCVGDTVVDPYAATLPYGRSITLGPFTCTSGETGMTCTNANGGGFTVAKARQSLF
jgi:hypothetical protein